MKKTKRVECWTIVDAHGFAIVTSGTRAEAEAIAQRWNSANAYDAPHRVRRFVELSPGSVVVSREEARVLRLAMRHARSADTDDSHTEGDLLNACAMVRATKARKR